MSNEEFIEELKKLNIVLSDKQRWQLDKYYELLIEWNQRINLTRITDKKDVYLKHFYDSITLCKMVDLNLNLSLCDIGTGAGFPGLVLKIVFPNLSITLIDALQKRVNFLNMVIQELGLNGVKAIHERGEDYAKINREKFDIVTSRAVANLSLLAEISLPLCKINGYFIPMKANCEEELTTLKPFLAKLNGEIVEQQEFLLPIENSYRTLIKIQKKGITNLKYPRRFNEMKKHCQ